MTQKILSFFTTALLAGASLLLLDSCREDTILDASIVPVGDTITVDGTDTITILTKTFFNDSTVTSSEFSGIPIFHTVGNVNDPVFGKTRSSIYMQVVPPSLDYKFPAQPDSAYLYIPYSGFSWGDTNSAVGQTFSVYEVTDSLDKDSVYYSSTTKAVDFSNLVGSVPNVTYQSLKDSVMVGKVKTRYMLAIPLSKSFVDKIYNESAKSASALKTYPEFLQFLKGLYIAADTNVIGDVMHYLRLDGSSDLTRANIMFYYTKDSVQTTSFYFNATYNAHYNRIIRNYTGSFAGNYLNSTAPSDSLIFLQNEPGLVADLKFPFVKNLPKQPVNKAELIITEYSWSADQKEKYFPPARIYPVGVTAEGKTFSILDRYPLSSTGPLTFMDGSRRSVEIGALTVNQYILNIPREVQKAISEGRDTLRLRISGASTYPGAYRLTGAGGKSFSNPAMSIKLNIVYSKL